MIKKEHILNTNLPMVCSSAEAEERTYKKIISGSKVWYVAIQEDAASNIYVANVDPEKNKKSEGFGGDLFILNLKMGQ
jgi:hypothetical protein